MQEMIGWMSSGILITTVGSQVLQQWRSRSSQGVSPALFLGQTAASAGMLVYAVLIHNWVNLVTNLVMLTIGVLGGYLTYRYRGQNPAEAEAPTSPLRARHRITRATQSRARRNRSAPPARIPRTAQPQD